MKKQGKSPAFLFCDFSKKYLTIGQKGGYNIDKRCRAYNVELGCDLKGYVETVRTYNTGKRRMRSVWNMATTASGGVTHYAKFPNELAERCILCGTAEGDVVLDPFVGSGTSCRVANRYGRQYIGD